MGCSSSCETDESSCNTPFGSFSVRHCAFGCKKKMVEPPMKTREEIYFDGLAKANPNGAEIQARVEYNLWKASLHRSHKKSKVNLKRRHSF